MQTQTTLGADALVFRLKVARILLERAEEQLEAIGQLADDALAPGIGEAAWLVSAALEELPRGAVA